MSNARQDAEAVCSLCGPLLHFAKEYPSVIAPLSYVVTIKQHNLLQRALYALYHFQDDIFGLKECFANSNQYTLTECVDDIFPIVKTCKMPKQLMRNFKRALGSLLTRRFTTGASPCEIAFCKCSSPKTLDVFDDDVCRQMTYLYEAMFPEQLGNNEPNETDDCETSDGYTYDSSTEDEYDVCETPQRKHNTHYDDDIIYETPKRKQPKRLIF